MHELPITESILKIVIEEANKYNADKVTSINLKIGELSSYIPESIQLYFDMMSKGTKAETAKLKIDKILIKKRCSNCNNVMDADMVSCPLCRGKDFNLVGGREFYIDSIEVE